MRKQIAAANWKMNLTIDEAHLLMDAILSGTYSLNENRQAIFAVPYPYLPLMQTKIQQPHMYLAAQDCSSKKSGAYTGEVSVTMLHSIGINYVIVGHSERREYHSETNSMLAEKLNLLLEKNMQPIFCCGEPLEIREAGNQNQFVQTQLQESLFHLSAEQMTGFIIAYEPIWAIGTGKTATSAQAQEMHAFIRSVLAAHYGSAVANTVSILYGGSVKASNAAELFGNPDVDGGLVGGASLIADEFKVIINSLK
jgi:triosephosphate isomerase